MTGFSQFKLFCIQCHNTDTLGGEEASRRRIQTLLNTPQKKQRFMNYIIDPKKLKKYSKMPGLDKRINLKRRTIIASNITDYIEYIIADQNFLKKKAEAKKMYKSLNKLMK